MTGEEPNECERYRRSGRVPASAVWAEVGTSLGQVGKRLLSRPVLARLANMIATSKTTLPHPQHTM